MDFGNLSEMMVTSVRIGNDKKMCMPLRKHRMHSVCGRHHDDRERNTTEVFRKAYSVVYIISDLYLVLTEIAKVHNDIARSILKSIRPLLP